MKFFGLIMLASTAIAGSALAGEFRPVSRVDAVTVFPQGADVTRLAAVKLAPGDHQIIIENLPGDIDTKSIRVAGEGGTGLEIASVDSKVSPLAAENRDQQHKQIEKAISALFDERAALDQTAADAEAQRQFLFGLANKQLAPGSTDETIKGVDPAALGGLLDVMSTRLAVLAKTTQDARVRQKAIDERVAELQLEMANLAPQGGYRTQVTVHLAATRAVDGVFRVSYRIANAGWQPYYDAKLEVPKNGAATPVEIVRRAEVLQSTTENWDNVELTLSTARPAGASAAPDIFEQEIAAVDYGSGSLGRSKAKLDSERLGDLSKQELPEAAPAASAKEEDAMKAMQRQAFIEKAGFQANYKITGRVSVDNSGTSKRVRIASETADAKLSVISIPRLDANAYLTASFVTKGEGPMLPGVVNLYRDGVYVGQGAVPLLAVGEEAKLGFGVDDLVKVTRKEVNRRTGEEGIISSSRVEERKWDITVKNLHAFAVPVTVYDRIPFATIDGVTVTMLPGTAPTEKDVEHKRGVMAWKFALEPAKEQVITFGYKVTTPESVQIGMVD